RTNPLPRLPATPRCLTIPLLPVICGVWMCMRLPPSPGPYEVGVCEMRGPRYEYGCQVDCALSLPTGCRAGEESGPPQQAGMDRAPAGLEASREMPERRGAVCDLTDSLDVGAQKKTCRALSYGLEMAPGRGQHCRDSVHRCAVTGQSCIRDI